MRKGIFAAAITIILLLGGATVRADGPSHPQATNSGSSSSSGQPTMATAPSAQTNQIRIDIQNRAFTPAKLTVWQGTTIVWTNRDNTAHTVTSDSSVNDTAFDSGPIQPGQQFGNIFGRTGTFAYHCSIHPDMTGTITVVARPALAPAQPPATGISKPAASATPSASAQANATATVNNYNTYNQEVEKEPASPATAPTVSYTTPADTKSQGTATQLPSTGPAEIVPLFIATTVFGAGVHYLYSFLRKKFA